MVSSARFGARTGQPGSQGDLRSFVPLLVRRCVSDELQKRLEHA